MSKSVVGEIAEQFPGPVHVRPSRARLVLPMVLAGLFALVGLWATSVGLWLVGPGLIATAAVAVCTGVRLRRAPYGITLWPDGFAVVAWGRHDVYRWRDVRDFRVLAEGEDSPLVVFDLVCRPRTALYEAYEIDAADLVDVLTGWQARALAASPR